MFDSCHLRKNQPAFLVEEHLIKDRSKMLLIKDELVITIQNLNTILETICEEILILRKSLFRVTSGLLIFIEFGHLVLCYQKNQKMNKYQKLIFSISALLHTRCGH